MLLATVRRRTRSVVFRVFSDSSSSRPLYARGRSALAITIPDVDSEDEKLTRKVEWSLFIAYTQIGCLEDTNQQSPSERIDPIVYFCKDINHTYFGADSFTLVTDVAKGLIT